MLVSKFKKIPNHQDGHFLKKFSYAFVGDEHAATNLLYNKGAQWLDVRYICCHGSWHAAYSQLKAHEERDQKK